MKHGRRDAVVVLVVLLLSAVIGGLYGPPVRATAADVSRLQDSVKNFTQVIATVQQNYAVPLDADRAIYDGAIPGMLRVLDPHSTFFDPHQYGLLREGLRGTYFGVGMSAVARGNYTMVLAPLPGSPAERAGIRPGDIIASVDGKSTEGLTTAQVADLLKGDRGTIVHVGVMRDGSAHPLTFRITRDEIARYDVDEVFLIRPGIGYLRLTDFESEDSSSEVAAALKQLDVAHLDGLILDLRGNPGGLLEEAVSIADMFLDKGQLVVSQQGRASHAKRYYATRGNGGVRVPVVLLVNGGSASASEILTAAIQDHDRGIVVGEQTFGKGLVQTVFPLSHGTGVALTTARYYTPSGRLIQRDYKDISLYDYLYNHKTPPPTEVRLTDGGRQVFGGGGITPDVAFRQPALNSFQIELLRHDIFYPSQGGVGNFTTYFLGTKPLITRDFTVDESVLAVFRSHLQQENIQFSDADVAANLEWIRKEIKQEVFTSVFGLPAGYEIELKNDPEVATAIASLPQARALYENVRRLMSRRAGTEAAQP